MSGDVPHGSSGPGGTISWEAVQDSIADWVIANSGLPDEEDEFGRHYWADQDPPRPPNSPYVMMTLMWSRMVGQDEIRYVRNEDDSITVEVSGPRVLHLSFECFAEDALGLAQASAVLDRIITSAEFPSVTEDLRAQSIGIGKVDQIKTLKGIEAFDLRAIVELDIHVTARMTEPGYEIRKIFTSDSGHGISRVIDLDDPP